MCEVLRHGKFVSLLLAANLASCSSGGTGPMLPSSGTSSMLPGGTLSNERERSAQSEVPTPIQHVVIIIQENRTPDYLFQGVPGADIAQYATDSHGDQVALQPVSLAAPYELDHHHTGFIRDYDHGKMDGFDAALSPKHYLRPFGYAPESEVAPYHDMAKQYVFADRMFQSNEGPSFPAHLYLISGTATDPDLEPYVVSGNPFNRQTGHPQPGGCDADSSTIVGTISIATGGGGPSPFPCFQRAVLSDFLDGKNVSWRYYEEGRGPGLWHPFDAIKHVRYSKDYANVISPSERVLTDIKSGQLAGVTWVAPADQWSDHCGKHGTTEGPSWVSAIVNAVGESKYWKSTAIFITWDDWGGWYDHVAPPIDNAYELGFRVPLVVVSPYARKAYVSKVQHEFGSLLAFTEETFGIPKGALKSTDVRADDLYDAFDFSQKPRAFVRIKAPPFDPERDPPSDDEDP
jgi:phospholipase C